MLTNTNCCQLVLTALTPSSLAGVQWLQQGDPGAAGATTERAQCRVAERELLPRRRHAHTQRLRPQQGDDQVVQADRRALLLDDST